MPIYEYRCTNGHTFEALQKFSDEALTECEVCGAPAQRVFHPVAIHFKGSGFYSTDYGRGKKKPSDKTDGASGDSGSKDGASKDGAKSSDSGATAPSSKAAEA